MGAAKFFAANKMSETGVESENGIKINKCINITVWFINSSSLTDKTIWTNWLPVYGCHHKIHGWTITDFHFIISAPTNPQPPTYLKSYFFKVPFFKGTFFYAASERKCELFSPEILSCFLNRAIARISGIFLEQLELFRENFWGFRNVNWKVYTLFSATPEK